MIVITPFATRVLSGNGGFGVRFAFYAVIQVVTILTVLLMGRHIRRSDLSWPGAPALQSESDDAGTAHGRGGIRHLDPAGVHHPVGLHPLGRVNASQAGPCKRP